jgi:LysM repeat protein
VHLSRGKEEKVLSKVVLATALVAGIAVVGNVQTAHAESQPNTNESQTKVMVQPGDSLSKIANNHQTTYVRLFDANTEIEHPDVIHPGEEIRIPAADEQIPARPLPGAVPQSAPQPAKPVAQKKTVSPKPKAAAKPVAVAGGDVWDKLAACEAGGNWSINTGNGYYGGLQFTLGSWKAVGGSGYPHQASREEQISRGQALQARQGWGAWPACSSKLGLR